MIFQSVDDKKECVGIYCNSEYIFDNIDFTKLTKTWKHTATSLEHDQIQYAWLRVKGRTLEEVCPDNLKEEWTQCSDRMNAFFKSIKTAKVDLNENCIFQIIPPPKFSRFLEIKNRITEHVFSNYDKPAEYDHLKNTVEMLEHIRSRTVIIDISSLKKDSYSEKNRTLLKNMKKTRRQVSYNLFGTKTGRLTVHKGHFPVLTMDRAHRKYVKPSNDAFVEIDFNGAEIRTLLALLGKEQPQVDIHDWNIQNVYSGSLSRDDAKKRFFAWLYNPSSKDSSCSAVYDRESVKKKFWDGEKVTTPFHRQIPSDEYHSVNYVLQSTSNDVCLEQAKKVFDFLKDKKSDIAFLMHDSIILDYSASDSSHMKDIIEMFGNTRFGKYVTNVKMGRNFGDLRELNWKP